MTRPVPISPDASRDLLGAVYAAAVSPGDWVEVLDRCVDTVGARSASIMSADGLTPGEYSLSATSSRLVRALSADGLLQRWHTEFAPLEAEAHTDLRDRPARELWLDNEFWPDEAALRERGDYRFLDALVGVRRKLAVRLNDNPRWYEVIAFHFESRLDRVPESAFAPTRHLVPHLGKALEMSAIFKELQQRHAATLAALDHVSIGMAVLDRYGNIVVCNAEAERILDAGHGIRRSIDGRLGCVDAEADARLRAALTTVTLALSGNDTSAECVLAFRREAASDPVIVELSPLRDSHRELDAFTGGSLVQMIDVGSHDACEMTRFAEAWHLSEAEADVAAGIVEGMTNGEIADRRGVSIDTIKSQVAQLFVKCRASSRVELVRAVLKTVPPVR